MKTPKSPPNKGLDSSVVTYLQNLRDDLETLNNSIKMKTEIQVKNVSSTNPTVRISTKKFKPKGCILISSSYPLDSFSIVKQGTEFEFSTSTDRPTISLTFLILGE